MCISSPAGSTCSRAVGIAGAGNIPDTPAQSSMYGDSPKQSSLYRGTCQWDSSSPAGSSAGSPFLLRMCTCRALRRYTCAQFLAGRLKTSFRTQSSTHTCHASSTQHLAFQCKGPARNCRIIAIACFLKHRTHGAMVIEQPAVINGSFSDAACRVSRSLLSCRLLDGFSLPITYRLKAV